MAKPILPTNFQDDIMNASMNGKRKYTLIQNTDGTVSLEDVTEYDQVGSNFGAGQINQTNTAVNESADKGKIIDDLGTISAVTEEGYIAGALAVKEINSNISGICTYVGADGKIHFVDAGGADTALNFNKEYTIPSLSITSVYNSGGTLNLNVANYNTVKIGSVSGNYSNGLYYTIAGTTYKSNISNKSINVSSMSTLQIMAKGSSNVNGDTVTFSNIQVCS